MGQQPRLQQSTRGALLVRAWPGPGACAHDALAEVLKKAEPGGGTAVAVVAGAVVIVASGGFA
jgi:hypothetical protein